MNYKNMNLNELKEVLGGYPVVTHSELLEIKDNPNVIRVKDEGESLLDFRKSDMRVFLSDDTEICILF